jgi:hypothetical protein
MFSEDFAKIPSSDQSEFASVVNRLLLKGFVVRDVFDPREKIMRVNSDFRFIERYYDLVDGYLKFSGWIVEKDLMLGVFALNNEYEENCIRIERDTSLILFTLRLIYEEERREGDQSATSLSIYVTTPMVMKYMMDHGITMPGKKLTTRLIDRSLRFLANHNIVSKVSGSYDEGNVSFYILPSIVYALDNEKIVAMSSAIDELNKKDNEETPLLGGNEDETAE